MLRAHIAGGNHPRSVEDAATLLRMRLVVILCHVFFRPAPIIPGRSSIAQEFFEKGTQGQFRSERECSTTTRVARAATLACKREYEQQVSPDGSDRGNRPTSYAVPVVVLQVFDLLVFNDGFWRKRARGGEIPGAVEIARRRFSDGNIFPFTEPLDSVRRIRRMHDPSRELDSTLCY
jgi:hypothetical protein